MISYSTNWCGPVNMNWYRKRGLTHFITKTVESEMISRIRDLPIGATYEIEVVHTHYAGGRIDICGLPEEDYYDGRHEYSLPIMCAEDWAALSDYLLGVKTEELLPYDTLIEQFEAHYGKRIRFEKVLAELKHTLEDLE